MDFYAAVAEAVARREVPECEAEWVTWKEGGPLSCGTLKKAPLGARLSRRHKHLRRK